MQRLWRAYGLSLALLGLFVVSWVGQTATGWVEFVGQQEALGQPAEVFGSGGYVWAWAQATLENWQSEFLQLLTFVLLSTYLVHRGSPQSRDGDDEMRATLERIEQRLERLDRGSAERRLAA